MAFFSTILNTIPRPWLIRASYWVSPIVAWYYKGDKFKDPIDGRGYRKLLPYGYENLRENALAPGSMSLERHRLMWLFLAEKTDFFNSSLRVLHVAPEQCFYKKFKKQSNLDYTTTDLYSPLADVKADICNLPFEDESFDFVICNHVLEHIEDDKKAMHEIFRVLKRGGKAILQIPMDYNRKVSYEDQTIISPEERAKHFGQYDHVRVYGLDYFDRLGEIGFEVQQVAAKDLLSQRDLTYYALAQEEIIPLVIRP